MGDAFPSAVSLVFLRGVRRRFINAESGASMECHEIDATPSVPRIKMIARARLSKIPNVVNHGENAT